MRHTRTLSPSYSLRLFFTRFEAIYPRSHIFYILTKNSSDYFDEFSNFMRSLITSPAIISPTTGGTKAVLPGTCLR